jgi:hypothetical protein
MPVQVETSARRLVSSPHDGYGLAYDDGVRAIDVWQATDASVSG